MNLEEMINDQLSGLNDKMIKLLFEGLKLDYAPFDKNMIEHELPSRAIRIIRIDMMAKKLSGERS